MKWVYIVFWVTYTYVSAPCPDQWAFDIRWSPIKFNCMAAHFEIVELESNAGFNNRTDAIKFLNDKKAEREKSVINVSDGKKEFLRFDGSIDKIRLDSIKIKVK